MNQSFYEQGYKAGNEKNSQPSQKAMLTADPAYVLGYTIGTADKNANTIPGANWGLEAAINGKKWGVKREELIEHVEDTVADEEESYRMIHTIHEIYDQESPSE